MFGIHVHFGRLIQEEVNPLYEIVLFVRLVSVCLSSVKNPHKLIILQISILKIGFLHITKEFLRIDSINFQGQLYQ